MISKDVVENIRLVAIDLDHTLLSKDLKISEKNKKSLQQVTSKGISVVIATGRMPSAIGLYLPSIAEFIDHYIPYNGACVIHQKSSQTLYSETIELESCFKFASRFAEDRYNVILFSGNTLYSRNSTDDAIKAHYNLRTGATFDQWGFHNTPSEIPIHKFFVYDLEINKEYDPHQESPLEQLTFEVVLDQLPSHLTARKTRLGYIEINSAQVSKMNALDFVLQLKNLDRSNLMSIGDGYNDLEMISGAGCGVAVGNAVQEVKDIADYIVGHHDNSGVSEALQLLL